MKKTDRRTAGGQSSQMQAHLPLRHLVREALFDTVIVAGVGLVGEVLEEERIALCGPRYRHDPQRQALRAGSLSSSLSLGGRQVEIERPRVRGIDGHEMVLPSWRVWSARDPLQQRAMEQMLVGVFRVNYFCRRIDSRFLLPGGRLLPHVNCYRAAKGLRGGGGDDKATEHGDAART